ncbi:MAG: hypothetical protein AABW86_06395 [Candidatus Micrarchaeota archaeon]
MGEITRNGQRERTSGLVRPLAIALSVAAFSGAFLMPKGLRGDEPKPRPAVITVAKGPAPASVGETKRMQGERCDTSMSYEELQRYDEETNSKYRRWESATTVGCIIQGWLPDGRAFSAAVVEDAGDRHFILEVGGVKAWGIPISRLEEISGERVKEVRLIVGMGTDSTGWYMQMFAVPVKSLGAKPDYNRDTLPYISLGYPDNNQIFGGNGIICRNPELSLAPRK